MKFLKSNKGQWILFACLFLLLSYGGIRMYYRLTDGFSYVNIHSSLDYNSQWAIAPPNDSKKQQLDAIVSQPFYYLGKGCQSYVFLSKDGEYIIKFVKYQRFTPQAWLAYLEWIPGIHPLRVKKIEKKQMKLDMLFTSWKNAYTYLPEEAGLVYVHLNKTPDFGKQMTIYDKMGTKHILELDQMEFLIQKKADMLCDSIRLLMKNEDEIEAKNLIQNVLTLILSEYSRGIADNDHALMQNTGVIGGKPIHIDAGQFVLREDIKNPKLYKQELFSKTYKFHKWLQKRYPSLAAYLEYELIQIIGPDYHTLQPQVKNHAWSEL